MSIYLNHAYEMLKKKGIIAVRSTYKDFNDIKNMIDEVFGENNYMCSYILRKNYKSRKSLSNKHEVLIIYKKENNEHIGEQNKEKFIDIHDYYLFDLKAEKEYSYHNIFDSKIVRK